MEQALRAEHKISIHALREEGDCNGNSIREGRKIFLSTPSARRATLHPAASSPRNPISIHALREEGDFFHVVPPNFCIISIHALREEGDCRFSMS